jgi:hypothetical protein
MIFAARPPERRRSDPQDERLEQEAIMPTLLSGIPRHFRARRTATILVGAADAGNAGATVPRLKLQQGFYCR